MGSIPACAGEPLLAFRLLRLVLVYPRVCGGTPMPRFCASRTSGLSPRVRGNLCERGLSDCPMGSIPACAGEPQPRVRHQPHHRVYPRVCGGTFVRRHGDGRDHGLSPRVRGNRLAMFHLPMCQRSIPACAGEPSGQSHPSHAGRVYPRVCGGTVLIGPVLAVVDGLSPRVRGNPFLTWGFVRAGA